MSCRAHSQFVTTAHSSDSVVVISKHVAQGILKDLNRYDELKKEVLLLKKSDTIRGEFLNLKDSIILVYSKQAASYKGLSADLTKQKEVILIEKASISYKLKVQKVKTITSQVIGLLAVIFLLIFKH